MTDSKYGVVRQEIPVFIISDGGNFTQAQEVFNDPLFVIHRIGESKDASWLNNIFTTADAKYPDTHMIISLTDHISALTSANTLAKVISDAVTQDDTWDTLGLNVSQDNCSDYDKGGRNLIHGYSIVDTSGTPLVWVISLRYRRKPANLTMKPVSKAIYPNIIKYEGKDELAHRCRSPPRDVQAVNAGSTPAVVVEQRNYYPFLRLIMALAVGIFLYYMYYIDMLPYSAMIVLIVVFVALIFFV